MTTLYETSSDDDGLTGPFVLPSKADLEAAAAEELSQDEQRADYIMARLKRYDAMTRGG